MLLFIPIRTDSPVRRSPRVNHALIALSIAIYLITDVFAAALGGDPDHPLKYRFLIRPTDLRLYQFFTYQFLHGDFWHLAGNMLFLWVFGNSVNSKMGHVAYLLFFLASGVFAGVGFAVGSQNPCLGASGAIAGVTTAYLVLFPRSAVTMFYWLWFYIGTIHIRALLLIGLKIILWDNIVAPRLSAGVGVDSVAYSAHIAGYLFGFVVCLLMLLIRALPRDQYDILALTKRFYLRQQFRATMADPNAQAKATYGRVARPVSVATERPIELPEAVATDEISRLRGETSDLLAKHDYEAAADRYETLVSKDPNQCLPRANMLLVANQLMTLNRYPQAAAAYERFLKAYPTAPDSGQVRLVLGIIYAKYLQQYEAAQTHLRECASRLTDPGQVQQATHWLETAVAALGQRPSTA
ncbi:MAG: rhomboid family intramembrane serine protease [Phycisphaerae bacterium]|nr:rhomboid family intramembrane serine protease [Phycisphaerae bacterium]